MTAGVGGSGRPRFRATKRCEKRSVLDVLAHVTDGQRLQCVLAIFAGWRVILHEAGTINGLGLMDVGNVPGHAFGAGFVDGLPGRGFAPEVHSRCEN